MAEQIQASIFRHRQACESVLRLRSSIDDEAAAMTRRGRNSFDEIQFFYTHSRLYTAYMTIMMSRSYASLKKRAKKEIRFVLKEERSKECWNEIRESKLSRWNFFALQSELNVSLVALHDTRIESAA